jgi:uncharacterized protein (TIGR02453 family)
MRQARRVDAFRGFGPEAFAWLAGLERDNTRTYFAANRERYETDVRGQLAAMLDELAREFGGEPFVFRQQRDLRFSADRAPYKTRTYGLLGGAPGAGGGLYAELSALGLYAGTGYYRMERDQLERYRTAVDDDGAGPALAAAAAAVGEAGLELAGQGLRTAPRGYPRDHPRIGLLRHTSVIVGGRLPAGAGIGRHDALAHVAGAWHAAAPVNAWLAAHVGSSTTPAEGRGRRR